MKKRDARWRARLRTSSPLATLGREASATVWSSTLRALGFSGWKRAILEESNVNLKEIIELIQSWRDGGQHDAVDGVGEQLGERLLLGAVAY